MSRAQSPSKERNGFDLQHQPCDGIGTDDLHQPCDGIGKDLLQLCDGIGTNDLHQPCDGIGTDDLHQPCDGIGKDLLQPCDGIGKDLLQLCDGVLTTDDGRSFPVHKIELAKRSGYFFRLFCNKTGRGKREYRVPGVQGRVLRDVLQFVYSGGLAVRDDNVCDLVVAADYLLLDGLVEHVRTSYVKDGLSDGGCLPLLATAAQIGRRDVLDDVYRYVQVHFEAATLSDGLGLGLLPLETLGALLDDRNVCARGEGSLWRAVCGWVRADSPARLSAVPALLTRLAVKEIDDRLASEVLDSDLVRENPFCEDLRRLRAAATTESDLEFLLAYIENHQGPGQSPNTHRHPKALHVVVQFCVLEQTDGIHAYLTFDEKIDLWRKVGEADICPDFIHAVGHKVYFFKTDENEILCFDLLTAEWADVPPFRIPRHYYGVVVLDGLVYVLGGISPTGDGMTAVECFDPRDGEWYGVAPMMPVYSFNAAELDGKIYVVGNNRASLDFEMTASFYEPAEDAWHALPPPPVYRFKFCLAVHQGRLYVVGGRNDDELLRFVEVFDPRTGVWSWHKNLPRAYYTPKAAVLEGRLVVYDNHLEDRNYLQTNPGVVWDEGVEDWVPFGESSPMNGLYQYTFVSLEDEGSLRNVSALNKDPKNVFTRSPFG